jgi:ArsR family transcriptional regulator
MNTSRGQIDTRHINLIFRAFSDRTRLRLLNLLQQGESCVGDLVKVIDIQQPSVSRHLAYLEKAGLVSVRQAGLWRYYRLSAASTSFQKTLLHCLASCFRTVPELQKDVKRAARLRKQGGCCPE